MADILDIPRAKKKLLERPMPPGDFLTGEAESFLPSAELRDWARATFIDWGGALHNPRYEHLERATLGFLWANGVNESDGRQIQGTCELVGQGRRKSWPAQRHALQIRHWFNGGLPDFIITLDAYRCEEMSDLEFCALVEHELHHAGQAEDEYGMPKFTPQGAPVWKLVPHDVEEFVGVVERYGDRNKPELEALVAAARKTPSIGLADMWMACGACRGGRSRKAA